MTTQPWEIEFDEKFRPVDFCNTGEHKMVYVEQTRDDIQAHILSSTIKLLQSQIDFWEGEMMSNPAEAGQFALHSDGYNQALEECIEADRELIKQLQ